MKVQNMALRMIGVAVTCLILGMSQPGYGMSFGKHHDSGGPASQGITQGYGANGNGTATNGASFNAQPYQLPIPEPATVLLFASGVLGLGLWRWKTNSKCR